MKKNSSDGSIVEHLEALRTMLLHSILAVCVMFPLGFVLAPKLINFLITNSIPLNMAQLHYFSPMEVFIIKLKMSLLIAFILAFPIIINEVRKFVFPALYHNERKFIVSLVFFSILLFGLGACLCVFVMLPLLMKFSVGFETSVLVATIGLNNFMTLAISLILAFGLMFQIPLLIFLGLKFDLISINILKHIRPYVVVGILIFAALLTPPDIISQLILAVPTYLLFEAGIFFASKMKIDVQREDD